jgi:hypothetical protein
MTHRHPSAQLIIRQEAKGSQSQSPEHRPHSFQYTISKIGHHVCDFGTSIAFQEDAKAVPHGRY